MSVITPINVSGYGDPLAADLGKIGHSIDDELLALFPGSRVVIRGVQSAKHGEPPDKLAKAILVDGTDRVSEASSHMIDSADRPIDLYGKECLITDENRPFVLSVLEGFHKWKPMCLERPQYPVDVWMVYDFDQLKNVEYIHKSYGVKTSDGYLFQDQDNKPRALLGVLTLVIK